MKKAVLNSSATSLKTVV